MKLQQFKDKWLQAEAQQFTGWDFSYIQGQMNSEPIPWDYKEIVLNYLKPNHQLLDMGTGGGEFLLTLNHPHLLTSVTEGYPPNIEVCKQQLAPLGIRVQSVIEDTNLGFEDKTFDMIINRHESFDIAEVHRILKQGGYFITQQVGGMNNNDLSRKILDDFTPKYSQHQLENNLAELREIGFNILLANEAFPYITFTSVEALVYFAKIIEWEFPHFTVESCFKELCQLQVEIEKKGCIVGTEHRFIIVAQKQ